MVNMALSSKIWVGDYLGVGIILAGFGGCGITGVVGLGCALRGWLPFRLGIGLVVVLAVFKSIWMPRRQDVKIYT